MIAYNFIMVTTILYGIQVKKQKTPQAVESFYCLDRRNSNKNSGRCLTIFCVVCFVIKNVCIERGKIYFFPQIVFSLTP